VRAVGSSSTRPAVVTVWVTCVAIVSGTPPKPEVRMATLLSVEEAATELGTPVRFVRRLVHERRIRFHKIGKYVRISRSDLDAFIAAGTVPPFRP
jgi:excisionase family DNA binding protein